MKDIRRATHLPFFFSLACIGVLFFHHIACAETVPLTGIIEPVQSALISFPDYGTIKTIFFHEGDQVQKGAVLIELDNELESLEVERKHIILENTTEIEATQIQADMLSKHLQASQALLKETGSISQEEVDKQDLEYRLALARIEQLKRQKEQEKVEYTIAKAQRDRRSLHAPFSGVVAEVFVSAGESSEPNKPLIRLINSTKCSLVINLEAKVAETLTKGQKVLLSTTTGEQAMNLDGTVSFISPEIDPSSSLRKVKILFANKNNMAIPGSSATLLLELDDNKPASQ